MTQLNFENLQDERAERTLKNITKKPSLKKATRIFCDAGFSMRNNIGNKRKVGRIAYKIGRGKFHMRTVTVPDIDGLTQYANLFELIGIMSALEAAKSKNVLIITDSKIAMAWTKRRMNDLGQFSEQHFKVKERIDKAKKKFDNFGIKWCAREDNLVGVWLEKMFT